MRWYKSVAGLFLIGFSLLIIFTSFKLGIGNLQSPGPGFMGFLASAFLFSLSLVILIQESIKTVKEKTIASAIPWENVVKILILIATLCGYALLLELLGYILCTFVLMFIMLLLYRPKVWHRQLVVAFIITAATYILFHKWLQVVLPTGVFRIGW